MKTGNTISNFPHPYPPYVREATAHFMRHGKHYLITSGTSGYFPNPSEVAVGDSWHGPFAVLGDPCPKDESRTTWHSQVSSVFKVPGKKDLYIALGDRWKPEHMHIPYETYEKHYAITYNPEADKSLLKTLPPFEGGPHNTSIANYVWLPFRFEGEMAYLDWKDEWRIEDYE